MKKLLTVLVLSAMLLSALAFTISAQANLGDINDNGKIDMTDYILLKRAYFGTFPLTEEQSARGDLNNNGKIDMTDYILLKRVYFGTWQIGATMDEATPDTVA